MSPSTIPPILRTLRCHGALLAVLPALVLLAAESPVRAQTGGETVKPYVMLLFDTSGSMIWPVCYSSYSAINGDNSQECPGTDVSCSSCNTSGCGNGKGDDSRLYKVKAGAYSVVNAYGEVTFGLARFHNLPAAFTCNAYWDSRAGGWKGAAVTCSSPGIAGNAADILVGLPEDDPEKVLLWMNNCDDYPTKGACGGTLPPSSGCTLCADCGGGCDMELRGVGSTPIGGSLFSIRQYLNTEIIPKDKKAACRPYKVILLTDGQGSCGSLATTEASKLHKNSQKAVPVHVIGFGDASLKPNLNNIAKAGGTAAAVVVDNEVSLALAMASIISESILAEKCNGADDDCDDNCDEDWPEVAVTDPQCKNLRSAKTCTVGVGVCQQQGTYVCKADGSGSACNAKAGTPGTEQCGNGLDDDCDGAVDEGCTPSCVPQLEICDGKDNDCDKAVDEDYKSVPCGSAIGECTPGKTACQGGKVVCVGGTGPSAEKCDNKDNNCDTIVDLLLETCYPPSSGCDLTTLTCTGTCALGSRLCTAGTWGSCAGYQGPKKEVCNGLDDDCNGQTDEGTGNTCTDYKTCKTYVTCATCPVKPTETCNGVDDDCSGVADDNVPGTGVACGKSIGECTAGKWVCTGGQMVCQGGKGPTSEICDNKDNDCNAKIDDNVSGVGQPCGTDTGECKKGKTECVGGKFVCKGGVSATPEVCDCKDNDCDGAVDEGSLCPGGSVCKNCKCTLPCSGGEFVCPGGFRCKNGYCEPDPCAQVTCQSTEWCRDGKCVSKCAGVTCNSYEKCEPTTGLCVDNSCRTKGCPSGERCVGYTCVKDPCPPGKCPQGQMCVGGVCKDVCLGVTCPAGQICQQGKCIPQDACDVKNCPENHVCKVVGGQARCEADPCAVISCTKGTVCYGGQCIADPCASTTCPSGFTCQVTRRGEADCIAKKGAAIPSTRQMVTTGGALGGCAVAGPGGGGALPVVLGLVLGVLVLVRRFGARRQRVRP